MPDQRRLYGMRTGVRVGGTAQPAPRRAALVCGVRTGVEGVARCDQDSAGAVFSPPKVLVRSEDDS